MAKKRSKQKSRSSRRSLRRRHGDARRVMGPGRIDEAATASLARAKLRARNQGDLSSAVLSAGYYAKKLKTTMFVYAGNSFMHTVWRVSQKPSEYLDPINNMGDRVASVTPDLVVAWHDVR